MVATGTAHGRTRGLRSPLSIAVILVLALVASTLTVLLPTASPAEADTAFGPVFSTNAPGDIVYVSNTLATCDPGWANCAAALAGGNFANNQVGGNMRLVDVDGDPATTNSSTASYALPTGGSVLWAGLYWTGYYQGANDDKDDVLFSTPASGGYVPITATFFDDWNGNDDFYTGHADVTALVQAGGSGVYGVADVAMTSNSGNTSGGWTIVVVERDPSSSWKNLTVNHGFGGVTGSTRMIDIGVSGFTAPPSGPINAEIGMITLEGDLPYTGDYAEFNGTRLTNGLNPSTNFFNSSISTNGVFNGGTNPGQSANTLGYDADIIGTSGLVPPNATSANVRLGTAGEWFFASVVTTAIEIYVPNLTTNLDKRAVDLNGEDLHPGDIVEYTITFDNTGEDPAIDTVVSDAIPAGTTYVPGSLQVVSDDGPAGPRTDVVDGDTAWFDGTSVFFNIGAGATGASGGEVAPVGEGGIAYEVRFQVQVDDGTEGDVISNIGSIDYTAKFLGEDYSADTSPVDLPVEPLVDLRLTKTDSPDPVTAGNQVTYTLTAFNDGPSDAAAVQVEDTLPTGLSFNAGASSTECSAAGSVVTCDLPSLAPGSATFTIVADVDGEIGVASVTNRATVSSATHEHDVLNNAATEPTAIVREVDLRIEKTGPAVVSAGENMSWIVTVDNDGPSDALAVDVVDALPAGIVLVSATPSGTGSCTGSVDCSWPSIDAGASETITVVATVPSSTADGTVLQNTASVTSADPEPDTADNVASSTAVVQKRADLRVDKQGRGGAPVAGGPVVYDVLVENLGPSDAVDLIVTDPVPTGLTFDPAASSPACSETGGTVTCDAALLVPGAQVTFVLAFDADPSMVDGANLNNTASVSSSTADPNPGNDSSTATDTVERQADVWIIKDDGTTTVDAGDQITYTLQFGNNGPSLATGVSVVDTLPPGVTFNSSPDCVPAGLAISCAIGDLAPGAAGSTTIVVDVNPALAQDSILQNGVVITATEDDPSTTNNSSEVTTDVNRAVNLNVEKDDLADPVIAGTEVTYSLRIENLGPSVETNVSLVDPLPAGLTFVSVGDPACSESTNVVTCSLGTMNPGDVFSTTVTAAVDPDLADGTILANRVVGDGDVSVPVDDTEETTASARADLAVAKAGPDRIVAGTEMTWTLDIDNAGPSTAAASTVTDALPAGVSFVSATTTAGAATCSHSAGIVTCDLGDVDPGDSIQIELVAAVHPSTPDGTVLTNTATVDTDTIDTDATNDTADVPTTVDARADLVASKSTLTNAVVAGTTASFQISVTNDGPSTALDVQMADVLPAGFVFDAAASSAGCASGVTCTAGTLLPGESGTFTIVASVDGGQAAGTFVNTTSASSSVVDPDAGNNDAQDDIDVQQQADLQIVKLAEDPTFVPGTTATWTLTVRNNGASNAADVVVSDVLPAGLVFDPAASSDECLAGVSCSLGTVLAGETVVLTLAASVDESATADVTNTATVSSPTPDPTPANNSSTEQSSLTPLADLSIDKVGPATATAGETVTYTFDVSNDGPSTATGVTVTDVLPVGMTFRTAGSSPECAAAVTCAIGSLASGASTTLTVVVEVGADVEDGIVLTNDASISSDVADPDPSNNDDAVDTEIVRLADLRVEKLPSAPTGVPGEAISWTIVVTNDGPSIATNVVMEDTMPNGLTATSVAATGITCSNTGASVGCSAASLQPGASATITIETDISADAADGTTVSNTVNVGADEDDPAPDDNTVAASIDLDASADLSIAKTSTPSTPLAGSQLTYTIAIANDGPSDAQDVLIADSLPPSLSVVSVSSDELTCVDVGQEVECSLATLAAGSSADVVIIADIDPDLPAGSSVVNTAEVTSATDDPDPTDNSNGDATVIDAAADIRVAKTTPKSPAVAGENQPWVVTVTNDGPSTATGVVLTDTLPAGVAFNAALSDSSCTSAAGVVTCPVGTLAVGGTASYVIATDVPADHADGSTLTNSADAIADQDDPDAANNTASAQVPVVNSADLSIVKDGDGLATAGSVFEWTLGVRNDGPSDAIDVVVTDTLPAGTTLAATADSRCAAAAALVTCSLGDVAAGATDTISLLVDVDASQAAASELANTASISSSTADPDPSDNDGSDTATVERTSSLDLVKNDLTDPVVAGETVEWEIVVTNHGPSDTANVTVSDALPTGVSFVAVDDARCGAVGDVVDCTFASLAAGAAETFVITGLVDAGLADGTVLENTANADSDSSPAISASEETSVRRSSDIGVTKTSDGDAVAGTNHAYTITVANAGPSDADDVVVTDHLPAGFSFVSASGATCSATGPIVTCSLGVIEAGASASFDLVVFVDDTAAENSRNNVTVASASPDPDPGNDNDSDDTIVRAEADLHMVKRLLDASLVPGTSAVWELFVVNDGPSQAEVVVIEDVLDPRLTFRADASSAACSAVDQTVTCSHALLEAGEHVAFLVVTDVAEDLTGTLGNTAAVSSNTPDPDPSSNESTVDLEAEPNADLAVSKEARGDDVVAGETIIYDVGVVNDGPSTAVDVVVTDPIPEGLSFLAAESDDRCVEDLATNSVRCTITTLAAGADDAFTLTFLVADDVVNGSPITNTVQAASATPDLDANDNGADSTVPADRAVSLTIEKMLIDEVLTPGTNATWEIRVSNGGPSRADNVVVTDLLAEGLTFLGGSESCSATGQLVTCTLDRLGVGNAATFTLETAVATDVPIGDLSNSATIASDESVDPVETTITVPVEPNDAALVVRKTAVDTDVDLGEPIRWRIEITNDGPDDVTVPVTLTDDLPSGLEFVSADAVDPLRCSHADGVVTCVVDRLAVGASSTFELETMTTVAGSMVNAVHATAHGVQGADALTDTAVAAVIERSSEPGGPLAFTGRTSGDLVRAALLLIALGFGFWLLGRRRSKDQEIAALD